MAKPRIEPRFDDGRRARARSDPPPVESQESDTDPGDSTLFEAEPGKADIFRRLVWMVAVVCLCVLAWESLKWYAESSDSTVLHERISRWQHEFATARRQMLDLPVRRIVGSSDSVAGRELRRQCDDLSTAFVANPEPATRELMLRYCQAYEHYRETGNVPRDLPDPAG